MLRKTWNELGLVRAPKSQRLPDIVTVEQLQQLLVTTRIRSYRVLFFTLYSLGLRLGGGLRLQVGDIDADRQRVHIRNAKATRTAWYRYRRQRSQSCATSGACIAIPHACSPIVAVASKAPPLPHHPWTGGAASR